MLAAVADMVIGMLNPQWLLTLYGGYKQQQAFDEAKEANEAQMEELRRLMGPERLNQLDSMTKELNRAELREIHQTTQELVDTARAQTGQSLAYLDQQQGEIGQRYEDVQRGFSQSAQEIAAGYGDLKREGLSYLEGAGTQAREDLREQFENLRGQTQASLTGRGFGGSTAYSNIQTGINEQEADAAERLRVNLDRERLGFVSDVDSRRLAYLGGAAQTAAGIGGQRLSAMERLAAVRSAAQGAGYGRELGAATTGSLAYTGALGRMNESALANYLRATGEYAQTVQGFNYAYPQTNMWQQIADRMWQNEALKKQAAASGPNELDYANTAIGALGLAAAGGTTASAAGLAPLALFCDRNKKKDIKELSIEEEDSFLDGIEGRLPLYSWTYKDTNDPAEHVGPMAQDWKVATGLGDGTTINTIDAVGVLLVCVKGLSGKIRELENRLDFMNASNDQIRTQLLS